MVGINLRGIIVSKYGSIASFARNVNWSVRKARDIVIGKQKPTVDDVSVLSDAMGITNSHEFTSVFFPDKFTM